MAKPKSGMVKSNLFIDPKVQKGLQFIAKQRGTTFSAVARDAMRTYVINALKEEKEVVSLEKGSEIMNVVTADS